MTNLLNLILAAGLFMAGCGEPATTESTPATTGDETPAASDSQPESPGYENLSVADFRTKMGEENVVVLDVRTPEETASGMIEGAQEVNVQDRAAFSEYIKGLDKDKTYLVYCRSGRRSAKACEMMAEQGFSSLYNLEGGFLAWEAEEE